MWEAVWTYTYSSFAFIFFPCDPLLFLLPLFPTDPLRGLRRPPGRPAVLGAPLRLVRDRGPLRRLRQAGAAEGRVPPHHDRLPHGQVQGGAGGRRQGDHLSVHAGIFMAFTLSLWEIKAILIFFAKRFSIKADHFTKKLIGKLFSKNKIGKHIFFIALLKQTGLTF